ncbi:MAG: hypothetical protein PWP16_1615 [Eubacteriaceae bacterium]|nr:hypothetical protein [Eubacteriaceae bacterium]MDN5308252.1 hypothetical protein [Eubacteriaceae bacterium]
MKRVLQYCGRLFVTFALWITAYNANSTCDFILYQPEPPKGIEKLKKYS